MSAKTKIKKESVAKVTEQSKQPRKDPLPEVPAALSEDYLARTLAVLGEGYALVGESLSRHDYLGAINLLIFSNEALGETKQLPYGCGAQAVRNMLAVLVEDYNAGK